MRPAPPLLLGLAGWRGAFFPSPFWRYIMCICNPPFSLQQQGRRTHTRSRMHNRTLTFYTYVIQQTPHKHTIGMASVYAGRPTHNTNTLSMSGFHTHAQSRLRNMLVHARSSSQQIPPCSCENQLWLVCPVSLHVCPHLDPPRGACTVSGINSLCVWPGTVWQPIVCLLLCNAKASCSFPCSSHRTQGSALYYTCTHALQQWKAIYRPAPQGHIKLLFREE